MPLSLSCPCGAKLNVPDTAAGKRVRCPKCGDPIAVPADIDDEPVPPARPRRRADDDKSDRAARSSRRRDDEDDDDRPRKKKRKTKSGGVPGWAWAAGGGVVLVVGAVVAVLAMGGNKGGGGSGGGGGGLFGKSAPPGFTDVRDADAGFRVFLPGQMKRLDPKKGNEGEGYAWGGMDGGTHTRVVSIKPAGANFTFGDNPDQLLNALKRYGGGGIDAPWNDVVAKTSVTPGGKPGLEVRVQYRKGWMDKDRPPEATKGFPELPPNAPPEVRKEWEEHKRLAEENEKKLKEGREKMDAGRTEKDLYLVTTDGKRVIVIHMSHKAEFPADDTLKTVRESFEFL